MRRCRLVALAILSHTLSQNPRTRVLRPASCVPVFVFATATIPSDRDPLVTYRISPLLVVFSLSPCPRCPLVRRRVVTQSVLATLLAAARQLGMRVASNGYLVARFGFGFGFWLLVQTQTQIQTVACGRT